MWFVFFERKVRPVVGGAGEEGSVFSGSNKWCMSVFGDVLVGVGLRLVCR
jgi:hypothetical protein